MRREAYSNPSGLQYCESSYQVCTFSIHQFGYGLTKPGAYTGWKSEKNDADRFHPTRVHQLPKVLVFGQKDASLFQCKTYNGLIIGP